MNNILSMDLGFGSVKYCIMDSNGKIIKLDKEVSGVVEVPKSEESVISSSNAYHNFNDKRYLLGDLSAKLEVKPIDLMKYEGYKEASPVIISYMMNKFSGNNITQLTIGISPFMWSKKDDYREYLSKMLNIKSEAIHIHPQGVSCHYAYQRFGLDIDDGKGQISMESTSKNYLGIDIGFNTIDTYLVINGQVLDHGIRGMEKEGVVLITDKIRDYVFEKMGLDLNQVECKEILDIGGYRKRGKVIDMTEDISKFVVDYITKLISKLEDEYGVQMNKMDNVILFGGGSCILKNYIDKSEVVKETIDELYGEEFLLIPNDKAEYYNTVGYAQLELS